ncbi:hypothetical protein BOO86_15960 [Mycobacterium sp. CBMA 234]|nr:hypothetical protein [Mycolicibacterium sp. CBMA 234]
MADLDADWQAIDWTHHTHDVAFRGRRIRYADVGSGPAVVLIHGQGGCWKWWLRQLPTLATQARTIALDLPGFGKSDPVATGDDVFAEHIASIIGLLDHLGLARAIIVGHSMGGVVALQLACDHPERVSGLLMTNAGGANITPGRLKWILVVLRLFNAVFSVPWVPRVVARNRLLRSILFSAGIYDRRTLTEPLASEILPEMAAPGFQQSLEAAAIAVNHVTPQLVTQPCLIVWGMKDRILPPMAGYELLSQIPDARLVPVHNVGHCPMIEVPARFNELLAHFARDPAHGRPGPAKPALPRTPPSTSAKRA